MMKALRSKIITIISLSLFGIIQAQETDFLTVYKSEGIQIQGYLQFGVNAVAETNLFWNLADVPELDYNSDTQWLESYAKPGLGFTVPVGKSKFYGRVSAVWSSTLGTDAFDEGIRVDSRWRNLMWVTCLQ